MVTVVYLVTGITIHFQFQRPGVRFHREEAQAAVRQGMDACGGSLVPSRLDLTAELRNTRRAGSVIHLVSLLIKSLSGPLSAAIECVRRFGLCQDPGS